MLKVPTQINRTPVKVCPPDYAPGIAGCPRIRRGIYTGRCDTIPAFPVPCDVNRGYEYLGQVNTSPVTRAR